MGNKTDYVEVSLIAKCLREIEDQFYVKIVDDMSLLTQVYELRYQVYCTERGFEKGAQQPGQAGMEFDDFDVRSRHIALIDRQTNQLVGTARMVQPVLASLRSSFPMQTVCSPSLFAKLPLDTTVEVSRFAISKQRRSARSAWSTSAARASDLSRNPPRFRWISSRKSLIVPPVAKAS